MVVLIVVSTIEVTILVSAIATIPSGCIIVVVKISNSEKLLQVKHTEKFNYLFIITRHISAIVFLLLLSPYFCPFILYWLHSVYFIWDPSIQARYPKSKAPKFMLETRNEREKRTEIHDIVGKHRKDLFCFQHHSKKPTWISGRRMPSSMQEWSKAWHAGNNFESKYEIVW